MKWVTRSHVHVDRVACPWLISRFIDSDAEFLFVPSSKIQEAVEREGAIPFDAPDVEFGHHGDDCSFDTLIKHYELTDKALLRLAKIINAADISAEGKVDREPMAIGFEAIAVGYGLRFPNDRENLQHQFEVYDALYAYCRLLVAQDQSALR